jgi:hypothetical protein
MKAIVVIVLLALIACLAMSAGCSSNGGIANPMEGVKLNMNIPITKAPNSFIDPHAVPAPTPTVNATLAEGEFAITPTSTYVFRYE